MKSIVPFCSFEELNELIDCNVDEFYCGLLLEEWTNQYSLSFSSNKRAKKSSSLQSFEELKKSYDLIKSRDKEMYFIFNNFYVKSQKEMVDYMFKKAKDIGIKKYTVTDFYMINKVKDNNLDPILSCTTPVLNKDAAAFFKELGVKKIILPRDLSLDEISNITKNVGLDYEVIIKNESCPNIDGLCRFFHGQKKDGSFVTHACSVDFDIKIKSDLNDNLKEELISRIKKNLTKTKYSNYCGVCYILKLDKIGVNYLKIPSRGHSIESKKKDIDFVYFGIEKLKIKDLSFENYMVLVQKDYFSKYNHICTKNCYYS